MGEYVRERRERALGLTREQVASRGGPSAGTQRNVEQNLKPGHVYETSSLARLARALGWTDDSIERIGRGEEPVERPPDAGAVSRNGTQPADEWEIEVRVRPERKLSEAERAVVEADMLAAARRALLELERHGT